MQTLLFGLFDFVAKNRWAQWLIFAVLVLATLGFYLAWRDNDVRKREREKQAVRDAEEQRRIDAARAQQSQENIDNATRAEETAAGVPWVRHRDELWDKSPGDARILLDPAERSGS